MKNTVFACAIALIALGPVDIAQGQPTGVKAAVAAAVAGSDRPEADKARDAARKPAEMLEFAGIGPGVKVVEFAPGTGYFTRIFAKAVGPTGKVYAGSPPGRGGGPPAVAAIAADATYGGVIVVTPLLADGGVTAPEKVDVVWTSRNYHDLGARTASFNKAAFDVLKPGGVYIVLDHSAGTDGAADAPTKLHRINPEMVKKEVIAAGFQFVSENKTLYNPTDKHTEMVFEQGIRDHTDQFILKFRKPG